MTSYALKLIAIITMTIDHIGYIFFPEAQWLRMIGRISFPVFCFLLTEGYTHTGNLKKYGLRLFVFAVISFVPYSWFIYGSLFSLNSMNIYFELFAGLTALYFTEKGIKGKPLYFAVPVIICILAQLFSFSYGAYGVLLIIGFYLLKGKSLPIITCVAGLTVLYCVFIGRGWLQIYAVFSVIPILLYNGKKGINMPKYAFYAYYPVHLLLLRVIKSFILP